MHFDGLSFQFTLLVLCADTYSKISRSSHQGTGSHQLLNEVQAQKKKGLLKLKGTFRVITFKMRNKPGALPMAAQLTRRSPGIRILVLSHWFKALVELNA